MKTRAPLHPAVEPLEARIAPAAVFHYTDVDGDKVTLTSSTGVNADLANAAHVVGGQLQLLDLQTAMFGNEFRDADITLSVVKAGGGDGLANIGFINATGVDLGKVTIKGDLARIVAGDAVTMDDPGVKSLNVRTLGTLGLATGATNLDSIITGSLGTLTVTKDFTVAFFRVVSGNLGSLKIGGDLAGGTASNSGQINVGGALGSVTIGGSLLGGNFTGVTSFGDQTGKIIATGSIGTVKIGGSIVGGGFESGQIVSGTSMGAVTIGGSILGGSSFGAGKLSAGTTLGLVKIKGSVIGGAGGGSGIVTSTGALAGVQIGGDLVGGAADSSGQISTSASIGPVKIRGNLIGGQAFVDKSIVSSGLIFAAGRIASVTIGGAIVGGSESGTGSANACGSIRAGADIGALSVGRGIFGSESSPVTISAGGRAVKPVAGDDLAIGKITIKGDVRSALILVGFSTVLASVNADASIGLVSVSGDWVASSLVAGAQDAGAFGFGAGDILQSVGDTALVARIAGITIRGSVNGTVTIGDHFGFVAQQIDKLIIGGRSAALTAGKSNDALPIAFAPDVAVLEV